ncbi:MAG: T9SS type A sorting domain-containing protein [bacterium]
MKKVFLVLGLLICIGSAQGQWQPAGFSGSNIKCIAQHPQDTSTMLVSVVDSIFQSLDGGYSWSFLTHFNGLPVNCMMYDPIHFDTVYALLGNGSFSDGIYRSTDGGYNWAVVEWMLCPRDMFIFHPIILVGGDGPGVFKSEDNGNTWIVWNAGLADSHVHAVSYCAPFGDSLPIFFAGTSQGLFFRSLDTWTQANGIAVNVRVSSIAHAEDADLGFATVGCGSWSDGIYRSTDFGQTWQVVHWWIYSSCVAMNPAWQYYPYDTFGIFAGDSGLGVSYSSDCGTSWQEVNSGLGNLFVNMLSFHPQDSMRLFAATQEGLYRYQYSPGVTENRVGELNVSAIRMPTVQRAGVPITLSYSVLDNAIVLPFWVRIFDATGRLKSIETLDPGSSVLAPIHESGVYFLTIVDQGRLHKEKIIIVD